MMTIRRRPRIPCDSCSSHLTTVSHDPVTVNRFCPYFFVPAHFISINREGLSSGSSIPLSETFA
jgi:hypothetical protein